jgi:acetyl esterase/lipase
MRERNFRWSKVSIDVGLEGTLVDGFDPCCGFPFRHAGLMKTIAVVITAWAVVSVLSMAGPPPVPTKADVSYGPDAHQIMDICVPPKGDGPFPVVLFYGGIWKSDKHVPDLNRFFPGGCAVIGVETRGMQDATKDKISPPISVVLLDARRAVQFVRLHAAEWNLDPRRIAVAGGSQAAIPALYVACEGEQANLQSSDPVERVSTKVVCAGSYRGPGSIDPKRLLEWDPGDTWGAPSLGCSFADSLKNRDQLLPLINQWSPDALLTKNAPPIYIQYDWGLTKPAEITEDNYRIHSPLLALGFQKLAQERGAICYVKFPGHDSEKYKDMWDFLVQQLNPVPALP